MAHRYLYYVKNTPVISDFEYDMLEKVALDVISKDHPLNSSGSDLEESYSDEIKQIANKLINYDRTTT